MALQEHFAEVEGDAANIVSGPESAVDRHALIEDLAACFARLRQRERDMLWERHVEGDTCATIATRHGLATSSVATLLQRARQRLRTFLEAQETDFL